MGAIQLINRTNKKPFSEIDEQSVTELAKVLGVALYNQKRIAKGRNTKFDYLLENHLLTQKELNKAIADARQRKDSVVIDPDEGFQDSEKGYWKITE